MDVQIERLARSFMKPDAEKITTVSGSLTVAMVDQKYLSVENWDKRSLLLMLIKREKPETSVVFCRTKATVAKVRSYLQDKGVNAAELHGNLDQSRRNKVMARFRDEGIDVLVASDVAARGLDVDHITHVINYDLPEDPENYIHRIGRTARAGRKGIAWTFVTPEQGQMLSEVEKMSGALIEKMEYPRLQARPHSQGRAGRTGHRREETRETPRPERSGHRRRHQPRRRVQRGGTQGDVPRREDPQDAAAQDAGEQVQATAVGGRRGPWAWAVKSWAVGRGPWAVGRGPWAVGRAIVFLQVGRAARCMGPADLRSRAQKEPPRHPSGSPHGPLLTAHTALSAPPSRSPPPPLQPICSVGESLHAAHRPRP